MANCEELRMKFLHMYDRAMHHGDFGPTEDLCRIDFACSNPNRKPVDGIEGIKASIRAQRAAFENLRMDIELCFACEEGVALAWRFSGTHVKEYLGVPPSGKLIEAEGLSIHELADGKSLGGRSNSNLRDKLREAYAEANGVS